MKRFFFAVLAVSILFYPCLCRAEEKWKTSKSTHFIVYFKNAPESFIEQLVDKAEYYYDRIADNLGFTRFNFWLWDNRAKVYIYDDANDYRVSTGQPGWSAGAARPREKIIYTYPYAQGFFETILPHEMGHIIFREFVGFDNHAIPGWLDEGVASYQESMRYSAALAVAKKAAREGALIPLDKLAQINPQSIIDQSSAQLYYAEAISLVDYLIKEHGKDNFVIFCQNLRDKKDLRQSLCLVYPFSGLQDFDEAWQRYLKK
ncbi:MAG: peptidase MA family metallohydrolase [Candidatus Omnitrophota bacterium]